MLSGINALSANSVSLLFGAGTTSAAAPATSAEKILSEVTGHTDDVFKAGNAIGKIIEIASGMKSSEGMFTMDGATRTENSDGGYSLTKTGTGRAVAEGTYEDRAIANLQKQAAGTGAKADWARSYLDAMKSGTIKEYDMSSMGVTSTMTQTDSYHADGSSRGSSNSWDTKGMDQFLATYVDIKDGVMYDKATGQHSSISQNGTVLTYSVW